MSYPYINGNNLEEPQKYMYTKYEGMTFWNSYLAHRKELIKGLSTTEPQETPVLKGREITKGGFYQTHAIMSECLSENKNIKEEFLLKLLQRFEVSKRFYDTYKLSFRSKVGNFQTEDLYLMGFHLFLGEFKETKDLRFLNVALKIGDTLVSMFHMKLISEKYFEYLKSALTMELSIVNDLRSQSEPIK